VAPAWSVPGRGRWDESGARQYLPTATPDERFQPHPLLAPQIENAERRDAIARSGTRKAQLAARIGATLAEPIARAPIEALRQRLLLWL